jgi:O-antigen ligase
VLLLVRAGGRARLRAIIWTPIAIGLVLVSVAWLVPGALTTARQRLVSLGQYSTDPSVRYRIVESRHVAAQIRARPLAGSGLGASIRWGQPYARVLPSDWTYSHVGYLWLAWKLGLPGAALLVALMLAPALWRGPPNGEPLTEAVRRGCQSALLALLVASTAFPIFDSLETSCAIGLLIAIAVAPGRVQRSLSRSDSWRHWGTHGVGEAQASR